MLTGNNFYVVGSQQQGLTMSAIPTYGIANTLLVVGSETFTSSTASGQGTGVVWAVNVAGSTCSDEYYRLSGFHGKGSVP